MSTSSRSSEDDVTGPLNFDESCRSTKSTLIKRISYIFYLDAKTDTKGISIIMKISYTN